MSEAGAAVESDEPWRWAGICQRAGGPGSAVTVDRMGAAEEIFPSERRLDYVQTEWAEGWSAGASGFGYAAEFLTKHARSFGATIDQAGLAVFFLQRHRVELVLKDLLGVLGMKFPSTHSLRRLWQLCEQGFAPVDGLSWVEFEQGNGGFIEAMIAVDDGAATFRFPEDRDGEAIERPAFIDLGALNRHADKLYWDAVGCINFVSEGAAAIAEAEAEFGGDDAAEWGR
jgi:hypothetical protein